MPQAETPALPEAWETTVLSHTQRLRAVIAKVLGPGDGIEDVLQDVLVAAIASAEQAGSIRDVESWLSGIARNKARMHQRGQGRRRRRDSSAAGQRSAAANQSNPLSLLIAGEDRNRRQAALQDLATDDREILNMKYVQRMTYDQIAHRLRIDRNAVTHRLRTARRRLREALDTHLESENGS